VVALNDNYADGIDGYPAGVFYLSLKHCEYGLKATRTEKQLKKKAGKVFAADFMDLHCFSVYNTEHVRG
jgi:hypothetical protein